MSDVSFNFNDSEYDNLFGFHQLFLILVYLLRLKTRNTGFYSIVSDTLRYPLCQYIPLCFNL